MMRKIIEIMKIEVQHDNEDNNELDNKHHRKRK